jgi:hypothetical protein
MADDVSFLEYGFKTAVALIFTVGGWLWAKLMGAVTQTKDDLAAHRLYTSENYAKKTDLGPIYQTLQSIQMDIKTLLSRKNTHRKDDDDDDN